MMKKRMTKFIKMPDREQETKIYVVRAAKYKKALMQSIRYGFEKILIILYCFSLIYINYELGFHYKILHSPHIFPLTYSKSESSRLYSVRSAWRLKHSVCIVSRYLWSNFQIYMWIMWSIIKDCWRQMCRNRIRTTVTINKLEQFIGY